MLTIKKKRNIFIAEEMDIKNPVFDYIRYKQLNWYGHVPRMNEERLPIIFETCQSGRRRRIRRKG